MKWLPVALTAIVALVAGAAWWVERGLNAPMALGDDEVLLTVEPGSTLSGVMNGLAADGYLAAPRVVSAFGRLTGRAQRIQAGEYRLQAGMTPRALLEDLVSGRVKLHQITLIEGWTVREVLAALRSHEAIEPVLRSDEPEGLASELGLDTPHAEGQFFPDTYRFARGTTDAELLRRAHGLLRDELSAAWDLRAEQLPFDTPYEALVLASIIERETGLDSERAQIAGVMARRLERGMRLQTDPTVIYGIGPAFDGNLTRVDLETDTPYNTYTRGGLPPTPIAIPGRDSLRAAVNPAPGDTLFFVASGRGDGSHVFTATLEAHNAAVRDYLARLRERDGP